MKYLIYGILILLSLCPKSYAEGWYYNASATSYSDITFWWRCENVTLDGSNDFTAGEDGVAALQSSAVINTAAVKIGTNGLDCPTAGDYALFTDSTGAAWPTGSGRVGFYLRITAFTTSCALIQKKYDADEYMTLEMYGTDELKFQYTNTSSTTAITTDANLTTATWYFVEIAYDDATNTKKIYVDGVEKIAVTDAFTTFTSGGSLRFGEAKGCGLSVDTHIDNIIISNDYTRDLNALKDIAAFPGP